jgi:hypothetical protein
MDTIASGAQLTRDRRSDTLICDEPREEAKAALRRCGCQSHQDANVTRSRATANQLADSGQARRGKSRRSPRVAKNVRRAAAEPAELDDGRSWVAPFIAFVSLLALYVATLAPSVMGGDSGELTAAALTGGVPHPPGYPIFAMLARAYAVLPLGHTPAWRVNLLSATATAAAAALLCALVQLWTRTRSAALVAAALFGTNAVVWLHATSAEVFGLNAFFVALAFLLWFGVERTASHRLVFALAFASGVGMCNHHTFVFVGFPLVLRSLWLARRSLGARGIGVAVALGLLGLAPYAYLAVASGSSAAVSWGDQTTVNGLMAHVLRRNYGTLSMGQAIQGSAFVEGATFFPTLWTFLGEAFPRLTWVGPPLALAGFYLTAKDRRARTNTFVLGSAMGLYVLGFCALSNLSTSTELYPAVMGRFCIQSDLMLSVAAGLGFAKLLSWLRERWPFIERWPHLAYAFPVAALLAGAGAHGGHASQRNNRVFSDFVNTALASLPPNAIVITVGDHLSGSTAYFHEVEKLRPDVVHLDREMLAFTWYVRRKLHLYPDLHLPEGGYGRSGWNIKQLLDGNPARTLVVIDRLDSWDESWKEGYKLATQGLVHALVPAVQFPSFEEWAMRDRKAMGNYDVVPALQGRDGSWEHAVGQLVLNTQVVRANIALVYSIARGTEPVAARLCATLIEDVIAKSGGDELLGIPGSAGLRQLYVGPSAWKDLGVCYEIISRVDSDYRPRVALAVQRFAERAKPDDPALPAARKFLEMRRGRTGRGP